MPRLGDLSETPFLIGTSGLLAVSFIFSVISIATAGWSNTVSRPFLEAYNAAKTDAERDSLLWAVGISVLVILGIMCLLFTSVIVTARFFGQSKGKLKLGGGLSFFTGVVFICALATFMGVHPPISTTYGYSFGLLWACVPLTFAAGVMLVMLPDSPFLDSED